MSHEHHLHDPTKTVRITTPRFCHQCGGEIALKNVKAGEPDRHVCIACGEVHWLENKIACGALIACEGGVVMLQRDIDPGRGKWAFPGGFVDRCESLQTAAKRESREEAKIEIENLELLGAYSYDGHPVVLVVYTADLASGTPQAGDEASGCEIWPLDRIRWDDLAFRSTKDAVADYVKRKG